MQKNCERIKNSTMKDYHYGSCPVGGKGNITEINLNAKNI